MLSLFTILALELDAIFVQPLDVGFICFKHITCIVVPQELLSPILPWRWLEVLEDALDKDFKAL